MGNMDHLLVLDNISALENIDFGKKYNKMEL
jgi:hypothetical protein